MDAVFRLKVVGRVEGSVQIDRVMADSVKADTFACCCGIGDHYPHIRIVVKELNFSFARLVVVLVAGIDAAMDVDSTKIG